VREDNDPIEALELDIDRRLKAANPAGFDRMIAARRERATELGSEPPPTFTAVAVNARRDEPPGPKELVVRVNPPASDEAIEALLTSLMAETFVEAQRSFAMARGCSVAGQPAGLRDTHIGQGARLCRAFAEMTVALARHKGKPARIVMEHHHHHVHRRIA
jgi:hypothetical protein